MEYDQSPYDDTLEIILEHTKEAPERQLAHVDALDAKVVQIFGAASVVMGLGGLSNLDSGRNESDLISGLLLGALGLYVVAVLSTIRHLWIRNFRSSGHADSLWSRAWWRRPSEVRHILVADISNVYLHNREVIEQKTRTLTIALLATAAEVVLVALALLVSRL